MNGRTNGSFGLVEQQQVQNGISPNLHEDSKKRIESSQQALHGPIYKRTQRRFNYFKRRKPYRKTKKKNSNETKEEHTDLNGNTCTNENETIDKNEKPLESIDGPCEWNLCEHESLEISTFEETTNKKNSSWRNFLFSKLHNATHTINRKFFAMFRICTVYPEYFVKGELRKTLELKNRELKQLQVNETLKKTDETNFSKEKIGKELKKKPYRKKSRNLCCTQFENDLNILNYQNIESNHLEIYNNNYMNGQSIDPYLNYPGKNSIYFESCETDNNLGNISSCASVQSVNHHKERMFNYNGMIRNDPKRQINGINNDYEKKWEDTFYSAEDLFPSDIPYEPCTNQHPYMFNQRECMNSHSNFQHDMFNGMIMDQRKLQTGEERSHKFQETYQGDFNNMNQVREGNFEKWNGNYFGECKDNDMYYENENENEQENNKNSEKPKQYQNIKHFYVASVSKTTNKRRLRKISLMELYCDPYFFILEHFLTDLESYLALNHCLMYVQKNQDQLAQIHDTFYSTLIDVDEVRFLERQITTSILRHILKRLNQLFQIPISEVQSVEFCLYLKNEPRKNMKRKRRECKIEKNHNKPYKEKEHGKNEEPPEKGEENSQGSIEKKDEERLKAEIEENKIEKEWDDKKARNEKCEDEEIQVEEEPIENEEIDEDMKDIPMEEAMNAEVEEETSVGKEQEIFEEKESETYVKTQAETEVNKGNEEILENLKNEQGEMEMEEYELEKNTQDENEDIEDKNEQNNENMEKECEEGTEENESENGREIEEEMEKEQKQEEKEKEIENEIENEEEEEEKGKTQSELEKNKKLEEDEEDDCINFVEHNIYKYSILIFLNTQNDSCIEFPNTGIKISPVLGNCLIYECNNANIINAFRFNIPDDKVCFIKLNLKDDLKLHELFHQPMETKEESFDTVYPHIPNMPNVPITNRMMGTNKINEIVRNNALNKIKETNRSMGTNQTDTMIQMNRFNQINRNVFRESNFPNTQSSKLSFDFFNQNINMFNANLSHTLGNDNLYLRRYIDNLNDNLQKLNLNSMQSMLVEQKRRTSCNQVIPANPYMSMNQYPAYESYELEEKQESEVPFYIPIEQMRHHLNNT